MILLKPLGLIALISLVVLLLIYILKPNFQQKFISSTFIWKLSLKYKKKKLPINKLRNILLIIVQVLTLCTLTAILVNPNKIIKTAEENEAILILDNSASMRCCLDGETRFERAIDLMKDKIDETFNNDGLLSIVISDTKPYFLAERESVERKWEIDENLAEFKTKNACSYGTSNLNDAINFCQEIYLDNPNVHVYIYTDLTIDYVPDRINIINVTEPGEYNGAILNAYAEVIDNYYSFVVDLACYGRDDEIVLTLQINSANVSDEMPNGQNITFEQNVTLSNDEVNRVIFINDNVSSDALATENTICYIIPDNEKILSYESVSISIDYDDCFEEDNVYNIYGGMKEVIKVLYASTAPNSFFSGILFVLQNRLQDRFNVTITEYKDKKNAPPSEGFDLYIYEHEMVPVMQPTDGIVIYSDPRSSVSGAGFTLNNEVSLDYIGLPLTPEKDSVILKNVAVDSITVKKYYRLFDYDASYDVIATCDTDPIIMVRDEEDVKAIVMLFSLHYSNLPILADFPVLMNNIVEYYLPATTNGNSFEVNTNVEINSRSSQITVSGNEVNETFDTSKCSMSFAIPGTYTISQTTYFGKSLNEFVYVKIPNQESNIFYEIDSLETNISDAKVEDFYKDLILILAITLTSLIFVEWLLKGNDSI